MPGERGIPSALLALAVLSGPGGLPPGTAVHWPRVWARAMVVMEPETGEVLVEEHAYERRPPASTTKMLTALVALRLGRLPDVIAVSPRAAATPGSSAHLRAGERYRLADLLAGLLLPSGNDAATAIAEHYGGSVAAFAVLMNRFARSLGATGSHFENPSGLTARGHYSTAYDLARIARAALADPRFARLVRAREMPLAAVGGLRPRTVRNTNRLLWEYPAATGVKTGTTSAAGKCLVASARGPGLSLISVVLDDPNRFADSRALLDAGLRQYAVVRGPELGQVAALLPVRCGRSPTVPAVTAGPLVAVVPASLRRQVQQEVYADPVPAPVRRGTPVGVLALVYGDRVLARTGLLAAADVARLPWPRLWWERIRGTGGCAPSR